MDVFPPQSDCVCTESFCEGEALKIDRGGGGGYSERKKGEEWSSTGGERWHGWIYMGVRGTAELNVS